MVTIHTWWCLFRISQPTLGSLGGCAGEYRILQAVEPVRGGAGSDSDSGSGAGAASRPDVRRAAAVEPRSPPLDAPNRDPADRAQHRTLSPGGEEEALRAENGAKMQPTPQRDRGDGLAYTKRVGSALCLFVLCLPFGRREVLGTWLMHVFSSPEFAHAIRQSREKWKYRYGSVGVVRLFLTRACDTNNGR
jgi:hypothetical protein